MKKLLIIVVTAAALASCNNDKTTDTAAKDSVNALTHTDSLAAAVAPASTIGVAEGDMMMKDGKMLLMKGGQWVDMAETMTTTIGDKVTAAGMLTRKDGTATQLSNGQQIKMSGELLDKEGKTLNNMREKVNVMMDSAKKK